MPDKQQFLSEIGGSNADARFRAWRRAGEMDTDVIADLAKLAAQRDPGIAKAAREAMSTMTHAVGKDASDAKRPAVVKQLLAVAVGAAPQDVRAHALRLLSLIAGEDSVPAIAKLLTVAEVAEEAAFCIERIPGAASEKALAAAYRQVKDDFKPRILAALGHRRSELGLALCAEAMRSPNAELAMAGMKAFGRIGRKPAAPPRYPDAAPLSVWQKVEHMDSQLRYADGLAASGNSADAMRIYKQALERPEPHWQCAGVIGLAKLGSAEAAAALFPMLSSKDRTVRITAENAWKAMARTAGKA